MKRRVMSILLMLTMAMSVALGGCSGDKEAPESTTKNELPESKTRSRAGVSKLVFPRILTVLTHTKQYRQEQKRFYLTFMKVW